MSIDNEKIIIKYSSYTEAQKKATNKYRTENKEKVNEQRKKYYQSRKDKDPDFLTYKRDKAKEYYNNKKSKSESDKETEPKDTDALEDLRYKSKDYHNDTITPDIQKIVKPKKVKKVRVCKTDEQKKAEKKMKQFLKSNIITEDTFNSVMENIRNSIYFFIDYSNKKGQINKVEFFKAETVQSNKPETDYDTTDTENIILGDEHILEDLKPESMKTPEKPILKRTPRTPKKVKSLVIDI